jgi:hypothetical protein
MNIAQIFAESVLKLGSQGPASAPAPAPTQSPEPERTKQKGNCPFCKDLVAAVVIEENTARRDKCKCPSCGEVIFICRGAGCHDYAKGTPSYDNEYCPECARNFAKVTASVGTTVLKVVGTVAGAALSAIALAAIKKKNE